MAAVLKFPDKRAPAQPQEARVADVDNGYTRIANELYDALILADLNKREQKVAHAIARKTYGFNKSFDRISDTQLAEMTGLHRTHVCNAKNELLDRRILKREGRTIGLNKVISEWKPAEYQSGYSVADSATETVAKPATGDVAVSVPTKDTIQKTKKTKDHNTSAEPAFADSTPVVIDPVAATPVTHPNPATQPQPTAQPVPAEPVVIAMPLNSGAEHAVTESFAAQMQALYPAVNVAQELRTMCGWLVANPTRRKTKSGITRFINAWLAKCQDRGGHSGVTRSRQPEPPMPRAFGEERPASKSGQDVRPKLFGE